MQTAAEFDPDIIKSYEIKIQIKVMLRDRMKFGLVPSKRKGGYSEILWLKASASADRLAELTMFFFPLFSRTG